LLVHGAPDEVAVGPVVAGVQRGEPLALLVRRCSTSNLISICPDQLRVVTSRHHKLERLNPFVAEEFNFVVPVCDRLFPVVFGQTKALLVDVQILTNSEPVHFSALSAVMGKPTLIGMPLSNHG